jgi:RNA polymerase sigma factor (sigma-70 family)
MKFPTENELIDACLRPATEEAAYRQIHVQFASGICRMLWWRGARDTEPEDIFSDSVLAFKAALCCGKYRREGKLSAFLRSVAINLWHTACRKKESLRRQEEKYAQTKPPELTATDPFIDEILEQQENMEAFSRCFSLLNPFYQQISKMKRDGMNREQIAEALGKTPEIIRTARHRIRKKITDCLSKNR